MSDNPGEDEDVSPDLANGLRILSRTIDRWLIAGIDPVLVSVDEQISGVQLKTAMERLKRSPT